MLGESSIFVPGDVAAPADVALPVSAPASLFVPDLQSGVLPYVASVDTFGAIQIPVANDQAILLRFPGWTDTNLPAGDPCLAVILDFLATFLVTDQNATAAWSSIAPGTKPVSHVYAHNPSDEAFNTNALPALFMWRESAKQAWAAEDWLRETTVVKALWVWRPSTQQKQRVRSSFVNAIVKAMGVGIERGRTPGWQQPGDPDRNAARFGSLFWTYAEFESFWLETWTTKNPLIVEDERKRRTYYPALELTFTLNENLVYGLDRFDVIGPAYLELINPDTGVTLVQGPL